MLALFTFHFVLTLFDLFDSGHLCSQFHAHYFICIIETQIKQIKYGFIFIYLLHHNLSTHTHTHAHSHTHTQTHTHTHTRAKCSFNQKCLYI